MPHTARIIKYHQISTNCVLLVADIHHTSSMLSLTTWGGSVWLGSSRAQRLSGLVGPGHHTPVMMLSSAQEDSTVKRTQTSAEHTRRKNIWPKSTSIPHWHQLNIFEHDITWQIARGDPVWPLLFGLSIYPWRWRNMVPGAKSVTGFRKGKARKRGSTSSQYWPQTRTHWTELNRIEQNWTWSRWIAQRVQDLLVCTVVTVWRSKPAGWFTTRVKRCSHPWSAFGFGGVICRPAGPSFHKKQLTRLRGFLVKVQSSGAWDTFVSKCIWF